MASVRERLLAEDWQAVAAALREAPYAFLRAELTAEECRAAAGLWTDQARFRAHVDMERHRFGRGAYRYFARPLPPLVQALRETAYPPLAEIANAWGARLGEAGCYPRTLDAFLRQCRQAGQARPTPLLLRYEAGGYNALHQDLYGAVAFPLQLVAFLSRPGRDHQGGEFLLVRQRPRAQSVGEAIAGEQGRLLVFANRFWPAEGARGAHRSVVRHGVSRVRRGTRFALGVIFHDAE
jgi:hypothetical protein